MLLLLSVNPAQEWADLCQAALDRLKEENTALLQHLSTLSSSSSSSNLNLNPNPNLTMKTPSKTEEDLVPHTSWLAVCKQKTQLKDKLAPACPPQACAVLKMVIHHVNLTNGWSTGRAHQQSSLRHAFPHLQALAQLGRPATIQSFPFCHHGHIWSPPETSSHHLLPFSLSWGQGDSPWLRG